jgi:acyl dehydratase
VPATYEQLLALRAKDVPYSYTERDSQLYALSIGMGRDPLNRAELPFVFEKTPLRTVPTQAVTVARQRLLWDVGLDVAKILHGEQRLTIHRPLPPAAGVLADHRVVEVYDRGRDKGLVIHVASAVRHAGDGQALFDVFNVVFARGDGGIGGATTRPPTPQALPQRAPDLVRVTETRPDQALLYRLTGDRNPLHADPDLAGRLGFRAPILHGSCTFAIACREILAGVCGYDDARMHSFGARFTSVVYPGEHIETDLWIDAAVVSFRCRVPARDAVVLDHGRCVLATPAQ